MSGWKPQGSQGARAEEDLTRPLGGTCTTRDAITRLRRSRGDKRAGGQVDSTGTAANGGVRAYLRVDLGTERVRRGSKGSKDPGSPPITDSATTGERPQSRFWVTIRPISGTRCAIKRNPVDALRRCRFLGPRLTGSLRQRGH